MMKPGLYDGISDLEYHAAKDSLSSSGARLLIEDGGPALFKYQLDNGAPGKDEYDHGHAAHKYVLGVGADVVRVEADTWRTKVAQTTKAEAREAGKIPVLAAVDDAAQAMARIVREHDIAGGFLATGSAEQSIYWTDEETGANLRARPDWMTWVDGRLVLVDYKTSKSHGRKEFAKAAASLGYFMQHPFYTEGVRAIGLHRDPAFVFITQSKTPPYIVTVCELKPHEVALGHALNRHAIQIYADCVAAAQWPDDSDEIHQISLPAWVHYRAEELLS